MPGPNGEKGDQGERGKAGPKGPKVLTLAYYLVSLPADSTRDHLDQKDIRGACRANWTQCEPSLTQRPTLSVCHIRASVAKMVTLVILAEMVIPVPTVEEAYRCCWQQRFQWTAWRRWRPMRPRINWTTREQNSLPHDTYKHWWLSIFDRVTQESWTRWGTRSPW